MDRLPRCLLAVLTGLVVLHLLTGWGRPVVPPQQAGGDVALAVAAPEALQGNGSTGQVPAGFVPRMGYRPAVVTGSGGAGPGRPDGGCSSPFGGTPYGFGAACRRHDYGYDLLRYAALTGRPLGPWARRAVDRRFAVELDRACRTTDCRFAAHVYAGAVAVNSWRQGEGVPVKEPLRALTVPPAAAGAVGLLVAVPGRRRRAVLRRGLRWLHRAGSATTRLAAPAAGAPVAGAALALAAWMQPTMLPHPWWVQVPLGALVVLQGYGLGLLVRAGARRCGPWLVGRVGGTAAARARAVGTAVAVAMSVTLPAAAFVVGHRGGAALRLSVGAAPTTWHEDLAVALAPVVVAVAGAGVLRLARRGLRAARRPHAHRRPLQVLTASALTVAVLSAASVPTAAMAGTAHDGAGPGTAREAARSAPVVDAPLVAGTKRADFLAPGRPCDDPAGSAAVRVYVGQDEAATAHARAVLAADALARAGAFDRPAILVAVPTGSGWVNQSAVCAVEGLYAGDVASVAVQYSARPSWLAYLSGGEGARASVRALFAELRRRVDARPPGSRPRLLVYGESLGAWAGLSAFPGSGGLGGGADAAVWAGPPAGSDLPASSSGGRVQVLSHRDDPVRSWSPGLLVRHAEPGPWTVQGARPRGRWWPVLTFWQVTADVVAARSAPDGHGHRYEGELVDAWRAALEGAGARAADADQPLP